MARIDNVLRRSILKGTERRILAENFVSLSVLKVLGYIFPLITLPYLARVIGVDKFGEIAFATAVVVYFQTFVDFGFDFTAVRDIARNRQDMESVSRIFSTVMVTKAILMIISFIILLVCIWIIPSFHSNRLMILLTFLYIPGYILFPDWFFQAMEEMRYITFLNLLSKLLFTILVFVLIKEKTDYIFQPVLIALGYLVSGLISVPLIIRKYRVSFYFPRRCDIIRAVKGSWNMFVCQFVPNLYSSFSIILLRSFSGIVPTGIYSGGYKFVELVNDLTLVLTRTFYPFLARRIDKHRTYVLISGTLSILAALLLFLLSGFLINLFYTKEFSEAVTVLKIMAVCPIFMFLMNSYGPNYLALIGKEDILRNIILVCSLGGFLLSLLIVPKFSYIGVAVTITIVWGVRGFLTWFFATRNLSHSR